jgi:hypothetical protein
MTERDDLELEFMTVLTAKPVKIKCSEAFHWSWVYIVL